MVDMTDVRSAHVNYTVTPLNFDGEITVDSVVIKTIKIDNNYQSKI